MTPLDAAVHLQAAMIRDGRPSDLAATAAWAAVRELWEARPRPVEGAYRPTKYWSALGAHVPRPPQD